MKQIYITICAICFMTFSLTTNAKNFIAGFEDIPLVNGFQQIENNDFSFGNEETHYIETQLIATDRQTFSNVKKFYQTALTQLGWTELVSTDTTLRFVRENDVLEIERINTSPLRISIILKNRA
ncbi:MAG: hypothetical protein NC218_05945 [Acetobacter sp.]|nr:hypothetical protein [Acetobacter sp.]